MQKNTILFLPLFIANIFTSYAMELEVEQTKLFKEVSSMNHYGLTESLLGNIQNQSDVHAVAQKQSHPESLCNIYTTLCAMTDDAKRTMLRKMSEKALLFTYIATCFPKEITKQICFFMFDGNEKKPEKYDAQQATEQFYCEYSVMEALGLYNDITTRLGDLTKPVGPLFVMDCAHRDIILGIHTSKHVNSRMARISSEQKQLLDDEIPDEVREIYLKDETVVVMDKWCAYLEGPSRFERMVRGAALGIGAAVLADGFESVIFTAIGACFCGDPSFGCSMPVQPIIAGISGGLGLYIFFARVGEDYDCCTSPTTL